ncbi:hypothetical protein OPT61_g8186 [Boeremia exigua]|uniref:Uncharacterized protein n=1 Tax=Boeremia exigua TaxID=749465 RepID=A0ACC2HZH0_9PLEO|nr:hypothetical protein OPT61_g8186 [Boeremia exigua]
MTFRSARRVRLLGLLSHLTQAEFRLYVEHTDRKFRLSPKPIIRGSPRPQKLHPRTYHPETSSWAPAEQNKDQHNLAPGSILKVVSWNLECFTPDPARRATAALDHLQERFGTAPGQPVVMLQELCDESLHAIHENPWVRQNFTLSDSTPPHSVYEEVPGENFIMRKLYWSAARYFTLMMVPRSIKVLDCFRVPFVSDMGRDALFVDIPISAGNASTSTKSIRLCTTHLESLYDFRGHRPSQLATIAELVKEARAADHDNIAGFIGGDMNAITKEDHRFHEAEDVNLKDVWEDVPAPPIPVLKRGQKDLTFGRVKGSTWGFQSNVSREKKRLDKFYYTGQLETVPLPESQDVTGKIGRVGIDLKTEVDAWETETKRRKLIRGKLVERVEKEYCSERLGKMRDRGRLVKIDHWVSDHFGITAGIRVRG